MLTRLPGNEKRIVSSDHTEWRRCVEQDALRVLGWRLLYGQRLDSIPCDPIDRPGEHGDIDPHVVGAANGEVSEVVHGDVVEPRPVR